MVIHQNDTLLLHCHLNLPTTTQCAELIVGRTPAGSSDIRR